MRSPPLRASSARVACMPIRRTKSCGRERWGAFEAHRYLRLPRVIASCNYIARVGGKPVAHLAMTTRSRHEARACRFVVMPEWQGMGLGMRFLNLSHQPSGANRNAGLFAGIEGFDLGFEQAGFKVAWQVEIDPCCAKCSPYVSLTPGRWLACPLSACQKLAGCYRHECRNSCLSPRRTACDG